MITLNEINYYNTKDLSEMLHLSIRTLQGMIRDGRLKAIKVGKSYYCTMDDIENYISQNGKKVGRE